VVLPSPRAVGSSTPLSPGLGVYTPGMEESRMVRLMVQVGRGG
jgi:hypothetical protein